jgi:hypothetical protein
MKSTHVEVRTSPTPRLIGTFALVLCLIFLAALVCPASLARQGAKPNHNVSGKWQGKLPSEQVNGVADADNPVAVEVVIKDESGKLSGTATFYMIVNQDNKPQVKGKAESALLDPRFDGTLLRFSVKAKGPQADREEDVQFLMRLKSDTEAELENMADSSSPVIKMKKAQ